MRVLLIKLSSMGDLIHALPALSDAQAAIPEIRFDWVIEESFAEVAKWHPAVDGIITTAHRRWRHQKWEVLRNNELIHFVRRLRATQYDLVIDGQTNWKSALVTRFARGLRCGLDRHSAREYIAHWMYQKKTCVPKNAHAVKRMRMLFAQLLGYPYQDTDPDFAIQIETLPKPHLVLPAEYLIFIHNASWDSKLWPENYWLELLKRATAQGHSILLPSGNAEEQARAIRFAQSNPKIIALPYLSLSEMAYVLAHAKAAVCNDTGLSHLTAAVQVPSVNLYGPTHSGLIGAPGKLQIHLQADFPCAPCNQKHCNYKTTAAETSESPACFTKLPPELVWSKLQTLLNNKIES